MKNLEIIPMRTEDAVFAAALEKTCFSAPWSVAMMTDAVLREDAVFLCAYFDGCFAGHAGMFCVLDEGQIANVAVKEAFRRRGIGTALISALTEEAVRRKLSLLMLEVRASNTGAQTLYEACGFERVGVRRGFYAHPREDGFLYNKSIKQML